MHPPPIRRIYGTRKKGGKKERIRQQIEISRRKGARGLEGSGLFEIIEGTRPRRAAAVTDQMDLEMIESLSDLEADDR